jgi:hypothetical protein
MTTENTNADTNTNEQDGFAALALALAGFGHTLEARTRLTYGKDVASALAGIVTGGYVIVMTEGITNVDADKYAAIVKQAPANVVALVDARDAAYSRVRPNVSTYLKSRKVAGAITPPRKDADGNAFAFLVRK